MTQPPAGRCSKLRNLCYHMASHTTNCADMLPPLLPLLPSQTYGVNAAASWGYQWRQPYATGEGQGLTADLHMDGGGGGGGQGVTGSSTPLFLKVCKININ